jgi:hypothetical protein
MAVLKTEPVLQLMTVVENKGTDAFLAAMIPRLLEQPLVEVAKAPDVAEAFAPIYAQQAQFVAQVKEKAQVIGPVVLVDLSEYVIEVAAKFVTYAFWPESAYSVLLTRSATKTKLSIGYNPWSAIPRTHDIAKICERHGGGGHPVVGAITVKPDEIDKAKALARSIAEELAS